MAIESCTQWVLYKWLAYTLNDAVFDGEIELKVHLHANALDTREPERARFCILVTNFTSIRTQKVGWQNGYMVSALFNY